MSFVLGKKGKLTKKIGRSTNTFILATVLLRQLEDLQQQNVRYMLTMKTYSFVQHH